MDHHYVSFLGQVMSFPAESASFLLSSLVFLRFVLLYTTQTGTLRKEASKIQNPNFKIPKSAIKVLKMICAFKCMPGSITWSVLWGANFELRTAQQGKTVPSSKMFSAQFFISWMFRCEYENTGRAPGGLGAPCGAGGSRAEPPGCSPSHHPRQGAGQLGGAGGAPRAAWLRGPVARHGRVAGRLEPSILLPRAG